MSIKSFKLFTESIYSMAARIAPSMFNKPATNNDYIVNKILITFPDTTTIAYDVMSESYNSDVINYVIGDKVGSQRNNREAYLLRAWYIDIFGDKIQMENYQEYVFVRCWNTPGDFIENDWDGYIFKNEIGFYEIQMKFGALLSDGYKHIKSPNYSDMYFKNDYFDDIKTIITIISKVKSELPDGINYNELMKIKKKFESWIMNDIDEFRPINLLEYKIDDISLISIIYSLQLKDPNILKNFMGSGPKISYSLLTKCSPSKILDIFY